MTLVSPFANTSGVPAIQPAAVTRHWGIVQATSPSTNTITVLADGVTLSGVQVRSGYGPAVGDVAILDVIGTGDIAQSYVTAVGVLSASLVNQIAQQFTSGQTSSSKPGDVASDGVLLNPSRADHKHGREASSTGAVVATSQSTTSGSYTDLATAGPAVTVVTGANAIVAVGALIVGNANGAFMAYAVSGSTTNAANDTDALVAVSAEFQASMVTVESGLTPGSNTFTAKYRSGSGGSSQTFANRWIVVIPLP